MSEDDPGKALNRLRDTLLEAKTYLLQEGDRAERIRQNLNLNQKLDERKDKNDQFFRES